MNNAVDNASLDTSALEKMIREVEKRAMVGGGVAPPKRVLTPFEQALVQVGMPHSTTLHSKNNGDVVVDVCGHMAEAVKWHKAFVAVYEFMQAQAGLDLFGDNPEAKAIYVSWISKGLHAMRNEAGGGVFV